jgi:hypothetical protein
MTASRPLAIFIVNRARAATAADGLVARVDGGIETRGAAARWRFAIDDVRETAISADCLTVTLSIRGC